MKNGILTLSLITLIAGASLLAGVSLLTAQQEGEKKSDLMETKTRHAEKILRALALGDLALVATEAQGLEDVTTEVGFDQRSERYGEYGREFLKAVGAMKKEAQAGNFSGSYYQFTRMTGLCFTCHEHVREPKK